MRLELQEYNHGMTEAKLRAVSAPKWDSYLDGRVALGPRVVTGSAVHSKKPLSRYDVYLDGVRVGSVHSAERRATRPTHKGSRIVSITGWPVEWYIDGQAYSRAYRQLNEAAYRLAADHLSDVSA